MTKNESVERRARASWTSATFAVIALCLLSGCGHRVIDPGTAPVTRLPPPMVSHNGAVSPSASPAIKQVPVSQVIELPPRDEAQQYHQVQPGETLSQIARRYGISASKIIEANGLDASAALQPEQLIYIPPAR